MNYEGKFLTGRNHKYFFSCVFVCIVCNLSYLHQADLLWARCPRRARKTSVHSELERCWGASAQNRGSSEGTVVGCPRSMHAGLNPYRRLLVKDRCPNWHHAGKQDRCKTDGQRHEGKSCQFQLWIKSMILLHMCVYRGMHLYSRNSKIEQGPHVLAQGAWSEETR